jgi:hypothetical protein
MEPPALLVLTSAGSDASSWLCVKWSRCNHTGLPDQSQQVTTDYTGCLLHVQALLMRIFDS